MIRLRITYKGRAFYARDVRYFECYAASELPHEPRETRVYVQTAQPILGEEVALAGGSHLEEGDCAAIFPFETLEAIVLSDYQVKIERALHGMPTSADSE